MLVVPVFMVFVMKSSRLNPNIIIKNIVKNTGKATLIIFHKLQTRGGGGGV